MSATARAILRTAAIGKRHIGMTLVCLVFCALISPYRVLGEEAESRPASRQEAQPFKYASNYLNTLTGLPSLEDTQRLLESSGFTCLKTPETKVADDVRIRDGKMEVKVEGEWHEVEMRQATYEGINLILANTHTGMILGYSRITTSPSFRKVDMLCLVQVSDGWKGQTQEGLEIGSSFAEFMQMYPQARRITKGDCAPMTYGLPIQIGGSTGSCSFLYADFDDQGILRVLRIDLVAAAQDQDHYPSDSGEAWKGSCRDYAEFVRSFTKKNREAESATDARARLEEHTPDKKAREEVAKSPAVKDTSAISHDDAMSYIAQQLKQYPEMRAFLFPANPSNPLKTTARIVIWNQAAAKVYPPPKYHARSLPDRVVSMELNSAGKAAMDDVMKRAGVTQGYRDDIFYELNWPHIRSIANRSFIESSARGRSR